MVSKETSLSVRNDKPIVVSSGVPQSAPAPKKTEPEKKVKKKKKVWPIILIIAAVLLLMAAAGFFGYKHYTNKKILESITGTWIYDTGSKETGYFSFFGDDEVMINGTTYEVSASKDKLVFEDSDEKKIAVEYELGTDELLLALAEDNDFLKECNLTISGTNAGVMLMRVGLDPYYDDVMIEEAYFEVFPQYAPSTSDDSVVDWDALQDILGDDFSYDDLESYLNDFEDSDSIGDFLAGIITGGDTEAGGTEDNDEFDFSDFINAYISGQIGDFGNEAGDYLGEAVDGTELEDVADAIYNFYEFYNSVTDEDATDEDILGAIGDLFGW